MLDLLARIISRHPWLVILSWVLIIAAALAVALGGVIGGQGLFDRTAAGVVVPGEAQDGTDLLAKTSTDGPIELLVLKGGGNNQATRAVFNRTRKGLERIEGVGKVSDPWSKYQITTVRNPDGLLAAIPFIANNGKSVLMVVTLDKGLPKARFKDDPEAGTQEAVLDQVRERLQAVSQQLPGTTGLVSGPDDIVQEVTSQVETDLRTGEGVALPLSLLIMVVVFGGFLAASLPILGAIASIAGALATLFGFSYLIDLDASTVNVVTVLGLGLCIDYGLLLVSRYREEMLNLPGDPLLPPSIRQRELALRRTMTSAGRTVTFSGVTVAISLTGLMCFQAGFLKAIGAAGVSVVVVAMLVALTLVPALLAVVKVRMIRPGLVHRMPLVGRIARTLGDATREEGFFSRLARLVQRFPLIVVLGVLSVLFVLSLPLLRLQLVASGVQLLPESNSQREAFDILDDGYLYAATPPIQVVAEQKIVSTQQKPDPFVADILKVPGVESVDPPTEQSGLSVLNVRLGNASPSSPIALDAVRDIRGLDPGYPTYVTGQAALLVDYLSDLKERAPLAVGVVVLATFILLFLMTGSVLVPIKALAMNVVSLGACLGVVVWVFQDGNLQNLLMFTSTGGIETFIPPLTLAFGFGLAMDYEVFLLSRIAEYRNQGYSNDESVVLGLQRSGRIISSAALIVVVVFLGFVAGQLLIIKETGLALAVAVAIDATLVRMLLVPATMTMLGEWNWWAPPFLRRLHNRYGISE